MIIKEFLNFEPDKEFRYTAFIYKDRHGNVVLDKGEKTTMTIFEEFTVKAKNQESADKKAAKKVVELYPTLKNFINCWRWGEVGKGIMDRFRAPGMPEPPKDYKPSWD